MKLQYVDIAYTLSYYGFVQYMESAIYINVGIL